MSVGKMRSVFRAHILKVKGVGTVRRGSESYFTVESSRLLQARGNHTVEQSHVAAERRVERWIMMPVTLTLTTCHPSPQATETDGHLELLSTAGEAPLTK